MSLSNERVKANVEVLGHGGMAGRTNTDNYTDLHVSCCAFQENCILTPPKQHELMCLYHLEQVSHMGLSQACSSYPFKQSHFILSADKVLEVCWRFDLPLGTSYFRSLGSCANHIWNWFNRCRLVFLMNNVWSAFRTNVHIMFIIWRA